MTKCLVTKLNGSVDNNALLRIGEMRIKVEDVVSPTKNTQGFSLSFIEPTTVEIVGDGYFTDNTLTENKGKSINITSSDEIFVNQATTVAIRNKYKLKTIDILVFAGIPYGENKVLKLDDLKYSSALIKLHFPKVQLTGDIENLKNLTALTTLVLNNTNVTGDIENLKNLTALTTLNISNTALKGDISNIYYIISKDKEFNIQLCNNLTGDLASLPNSILFINNRDGKSKFTWKKGSTRTNILACNNIYCANIDNMLNDMASMTATFVSEAIYHKTIKLVGTRTSASDAAVATLQSKGYTVSITPA
jgi:hypothetical protein